MIDTLKLTDIETDGGTQIRPVDEATVEAYAEAMAAGAEFPPITVFLDGESYWLADGFHRYRAVQRNGGDEIAAEVQDGSQRDAILYACGANAEHGRPRSNQEKRDAVLKLLEDPEWSQRSDRWIGEQCRVHHNTVHSIRENVTGELASERTYRTKHGTVATMDTAKIGSNQPVREPKEQPDDFKEGMQELVDAMKQPDDPESRPRKPQAMTPGRIGRTFLSEENRKIFRETLGWQYDLSESLERIDGMQVEPQAFVDQMDEIVEKQIRAHIEGAWDYLDRFRQALKVRDETIDSSE